MFPLSFFDIALVVFVTCELDRLEVHYFLNRV